MKKKKGFTLVELLIVVGIIGILAAIAIPQFNKYKARGYLATLQSDLKNAYTAAQAYLTDYPKTSINDIAMLKQRGFKQSNGVAVVSINFAAGSGAVVMNHASLTSGVATTNQGSIDFNGTYTMPSLK